MHFKRLVAIVGLLVLQAISAARAEVLFTGDAPALPQKWAAGSVSGLRARGAFEVNIKWRDGKMDSAIIRNIGDRNSVDVNYADKTTRLTLDSGATQSLNENLSKVTAAQ